jgi:biotin synthase
MKLNKIRLSIGSAIALDLADGRVDDRVEMTTLYLMLDHICMGSCSFCTKADGTLSRICWPAYDLDDVLEAISSYHRGERICVQCPLYPKMVDDLGVLLKRLDGLSKISISIPPPSPKKLKRLLPLVDRIGIALDCADEELFYRIKGYPWEKTIDSIRCAIGLKGDVTSHLIVGLGEDDLSLYNAMRLLISLGAYPALFAFTPLEGTEFAKRARPKIERYRAIQSLHFLLTSSRDPKPRFRGGKLIYLDLDGVERRAFMTSGCLSCNRPFYNETVLGPIYNYPWELDDGEFEKCIEEAMRYVGLR